jgi:SAM-dependent methyltransferase
MNESERAAVVDAIPPLERDDAPTAETRRCLVCGGTYQRSRLAGLIECASCGFTSADLDLSPAEFESLYGHDYFHGQEYLDYTAERETLQTNFQARIRTMRAIDPALSRARLFEIGCSYGYFLDLIRRDVASASGIDISTAAAAHARDVVGVDAKSGDYLEQRFVQPFDWIVMWDTIEHLARPDLFVAKAARDLAPGGYLAFTTGDLGSLNARLRGRRWRMIHPPTHMHYFSVATARRLLDANGFEVMHVSHPGVTRTVGSILYIVLALRLGRPSLYERLARWPIDRLALTLNLGDIMFVVARRRA